MTHHGAEARGPLERLEWHGDEPPNATTVSARLRDEGVEPMVWSNGPGDRYPDHRHAYTKLLMCASGSITFHLGATRTPVELRPGEGFVLPPGVDHSAVVGTDGCTCIEGHR